MKILVRAAFQSLLVVTFISGAMAPAANLTRGPYLQMATDASMTVRWRSDSDTDSVVRFGGDPAALNQTITVSGTRTEHEVALQGLTASTEYFYSVGSSSETLAGGDASYRFSTSPPPGTSEPTRVWIIGDAGTANSDAAAVYNSYVNYPGADATNLWLMLGDNAYNDGTDTQYQNAVFNLYPELLRRTPVWTTLGNHDGHSADSASESGPYYDIFTLPRNAEAGGLASGTEAYYSFDHGDIHFICLDSYETSRAPGSTMMTWLQADIAATDKNWIIAFWHHPPYTKGSHNSDTEGALIDMRQTALPIIEDYGVDLVFSGHSHSYERSYLIDGHYGSSGSFSPSHQVDAGDGREDGDGAYQKAEQSVNSGTVYTVAGASGKVSPGSLNHPAMYFSQSLLGSVVLDVNGNRLDARYLRTNGTEADHFTLIKGADTTAPQLVSADALDANSVTVSFSEPVEPSTAENTGNYVVSNGVAVTAASASGSEVTLTTAALISGQSYTVTVNNVDDVAGNIIAAGSQADFNYVDQQTTSFQDGVAPTASYAGTQDSYLASGQQGSNYGSSGDILADGDDGGNGELASILKWDVSDILPGATVIGASIELQVFNPSSGTYDVYASGSSWTEGSVTWSSIDPYASRGTLIGSFNPSVTGNYSVTLNSAGIALVQSWVDTGTNNGVLVMTGGTVDGIDMRSSEFGTLSQRPELVVTHSSGAASNQPPTASFTSSVNNLDVAFTDSSADSDGSIFSWLWEFGDSTTSAVQNPSHVYAAAGSYTVSLTVTDNEGATASVGQIVSVTEQNQPPTAAFSSTVNDLQVAFTDNSTDSESGIFSWLWEFGDGATSASQNPSHSYAATGSYTVSLTVADNQGTSDAISETISVVAPNQPPGANFTAAVSDLDVVFSDASTDSDGTVVSWNWDFGDGASSLVQNPSHTYAAGGSYNVTLTVTDNDGAVVNTSQTVAVTAAIPPQLVSADAPDANSVTVYYSEPVDPSTAENTGNYVVSDGVTVAMASASGSEVTLTTSALNSGNSYTVTVNNVEDLAGNVIAADSQIGFSYVDQQTSSFQNGVAPTASYAGTEDSYLASGQPGSNYGSSGDILADGYDGSNGELVSIIKWDISDILPGAAIVDASIELQVFNPSPGTYDVYASSSTWTEGSVNWSAIDPYTSRGTSIGSFNPGVTGTYFVPLNAAGVALVQSWVDTGINDGLLIMTGGTNDGIDMRSSEFGTVSQRPKLVITHSGGGISNQPPAAAFTSTGNDLDVAFTDGSTDSDGSIVNWLWDFGDGATSASQNPSHTYTAAGSYTVALTVTDDQGATDTVSQTVSVTEPNQLPVAAFTSNAINLDVTFTDSSTDSDGSIVSWLWEFGDGTTSASQDPSHSYVATGNYTVKLIVTDDQGSTDTVSDIVSVVAPNQPPVADFTAVANDLDVAFSDVSTDSDGIVSSWNWAFGDGANSTVQNPSHSYAAGGSYNVTLTVTDNDGAVVNTSQTVAVSATNQLPTAAFAFSATDISATFTDASSDSDGDIVGWSWSFGDGGASTDQNPIHSYASGGSYTVTLTATDNFGGSDSDSQTVTVTAPNQPPVAGFAVTTNNVSAQFNDSSTDADGSVDSWSWDFGDSTTSTAQNPSHSYAAAGSYVVVLSVTDNQGSSDSSSQTVVVEAPNQPPVAAFSSTATGLDVSFTDGSADSDGTVSSWLWNFGDGNMSTSQNPIHSYAASGTYNVSLTVADDNGATNATTANVSVTAPVVPVTTQFQQGLNGYSGARDSYVASRKSNDNYGDSSDLRADGFDKKRGTVISLLQWDVTAIPAGATVTSASITVKVNNSTNNDYNFWVMLAAWSEGNATWNNTLPQSNRGSLVGSFAPGSKTFYTITLNAAGISAVQNWVNGGANNGFTVESAGTNNDVKMRSADHGTESERPMLTVTWQ